jgi:Tol biopolymer transport system component
MGRVIIALSHGVVALLVFAVAAPQTATGAASREDANTLLFTAGNPAQLRLANVDTGAVRLLPAGRGAHLTPTWAPDGLWIAFAGDGQIKVVRATGRNLRRLTSDTSPSSSPIWSPDGRRLAFVRQSGQPGRTSWSDLMMTRTDGSNTRTLYTGSIRRQSLSWSRDGSTIVFASGVVSSDLYAASTQSGTVQRLTYDGGSREPVFSKDGGQLAFVRGTTTSYELVVSHNDGSGARILRSSMQPLSHPTWAPDGRWLAIVVGGRGKPSHLELVSVVNGVHRILTRPGKAMDESPSWSPTGDRVSFVRHEPRTPPASGVIATIRSSGAGLRVLSHARLIDRLGVVPQWKP